MNFNRQGYSIVGDNQAAQETIQKANELVYQLEGSDQVNAFCDVIQYYLKTNQYDKAVQILPKAERTALNRETVGQGTDPRTIGRVSGILLNMGLVDRALLYAQAVKDIYGYDFVYHEVIRKLVETNDFDRAKALLSNITDPGSRENAQNAIALGLAKTGHQAEAEAMYVQHILHSPWLDNNAQILVSLGLTFSTIGQREIARALFPKVLEAIGQLHSYQWMRINLLSDYAIGLAEYDESDLAMQIIRSHYFAESVSTEHHFRFEAERAALALAKHGHFDEALEINRGLLFWLESINPQYVHQTRASFLQETAIYLTEQHNPTWAAEVFEEVRAELETGSSNKPWRLNRLAGYLLRINKPDAARRLLEELSQFLFEASPKTLASAAFHWMQLDCQEQATEWFAIAQQKALQIEAASERAEELRWLTEVLYRIGRTDQARAIVPDLLNTIKLIKGKDSHFLRAH